MKRCGISFETLVDYFEGRAEASAAARVREHLGSGCRTCQDHLAWLENITPTLHEVARVPVPQRALDSAYTLFRERFPVPPRPSLLAFLQFDGRASSSLILSGARSAAQERFELIYSTDDYDIDLFQEPTEEGTWFLIGQILPKKEDAEIVAQQIVMTATDGKQVVVTPLKEEFYLPSLPAGTYEMRLQLAESDLVIPAVEVGR